MAVNATFYNFSKRKNSTAIPTGAGTVIAVELKSGVDMLNPSFLIAQENQPRYSYLLFEGRFYFITGVNNVRNGLWEIGAAIDALSTNKSAILAMNAFVLYYSHNNVEISDLRLSTKTAPTTQIAEGGFDSLGGTPAANCACVVTIVGEDSTGLFAVSQNDLKNIFSASMASDWRNDISNIERLYPYEYEGDIMAWLHNIANYFARGWEYLKLAFNWSLYKGNALECVKSAIQVPLSKADCGGIEQDIKIGGILTEINGYLITDRVFSDGVDVAIPWQADDWRRNAPYHTIYLYIPWIGVVNIAPSDVIGESTIHVSASVDKYTGAITFVAKAGNKTIFYGGTNAGSSYPIGSSNVSPLPVASSITEMAVGIAGDNPVMASSGFLGLANNLQPTATCIGSNTGASALGLNGNKVYCWTVFHDTTVNPHSISGVKGEPYNGVLSLANITGYVQTQDFSVAGDMTSTEKDLINDLMDGGVYIE